MSIRFSIIFALIGALLAPSTIDAQTESSMPAPTITSITRSLGRDGAIFVEGKAEKAGTILIEVVADGEEGVVFSDNASVQSDYTWSLTVSDSSFPAGAYVLRAQLRTTDGLLSDVAQARGYKVKPQPLLTIGAKEFGWLDAFLVFTFFVLAIAGFAGWHYERARRRREVYASITERDMNNMSALIAGDVDRLGSLLKDAQGIEPHIKAEAEYLIKNEQKILEKMQGYLTAGIRKIQ